MHGLYLLWWVQEKQMSAVVVAATLAAGDLARALFEVPTGWCADRFGHRASLIAGSVVQVAGMLYCWLGQGMPGLIAASLLVALGDGFRSGADQALLYRSCVCIGREQDFQTIEARTRAVQLAALVGLVLVGGAIVKAWGFAAGWAIETAVCAVGVAIACAMAEPPPATTGTDGSAPPSEGAPVLVTSIALILPAALLGGAASATSFLAQTTGHGEPAGIAALVAMVTLAEAAGSALAIRVQRAGLGAQAMLASLGAASLALAVAVPVLFLPVVVALAFLLGVAHPLRAVAIQRLVADRARARAASVASACDMAVMMVALPIAGVWRRRRRD
jgi:hypothetical protein